MIDKKIEEAARLDDEEYYDRLSDNDRCFFEYGFRRGYNRALNDLWHPASEKPNIKQGECCVTCLVKFKNGSTELCVYFRNPEGWVCDDMSPKDFKRNFKGWLYIDDLFPKEGGAYTEDFDAFEQEIYDQGFRNAISFMLWNPSERSCSNCEYKNSRAMWGRLLWNKILEPKIGGINMAWLAVNYHGVEVILSDRPKKLFRRLWGNDKTQIIPLPQGSIKKLIGRELKWEDEPVELKEE